MKKILALIITVFITALALRVTVRAQELDNANTQIEERLQSVRTSYQSALREYQNTEADFYFAKRQYEQLGTVASLEEALIQTQIFQRARAEVLIQYLDLVALRLLSGYGIDANQKQELIDELYQLQLALQNLQEKTNAADSPELIQSLDLEFSSLYSVIQLKVGQAKNQLDFGKLLYAYDLTKELIVDTQNFVENGEFSARELRQKERGLDFVAQTKEAIDSDIEQLKIQLDPSLITEETVIVESTQLYHSIFAKISQVLEYIEEISFTNV